MPPKSRAAAEPPAAQKAAEVAIEKALLSADFRDIESLVPYARNAKKHPDEQVATLAGLIEEFGWTNPVLADGKGIIAGHGRILAARKLYAAGRTIKLPNGVEIPPGTVPVIDCTGWSDEKRRFYILADNASAESPWDTELLALEFTELQALNFDMSLAGFDADFVKGVTGKRVHFGDPDEDAPEPPAAPCTRPGDIWVLGDHRIICGDATDAETVKAMLAGGAADLMVTDPPYGIGFGYDQHDDGSAQQCAKLVADVFALAPGAKVWTPGLMNLGRDLTRFGAAKVLVWHKKFAAAGNGLGGASTWEPVLVVDPPQRSLPNDHLEFMTERETLAGKSLGKHHPCPKPSALFAHLIESLSAAGQILYEPFSGSGTTIIAAEMTNRRCFAIEISPAYVDVAVERWQAFTKQAAVLEGDGRSFAEISAERCPDRAAPPAVEPAKPKRAKPPAKAKAAAGPSA